MGGIQNGTFGAPQAAPQYGGGSFVPPTLEQAEQNPGYQFQLQQGLKANSQAAAAAGGAVSGGTLKAADIFGQNLAQTDYQQVFQNALQQYNAGLSQYQAQLAGYGASLTGQQQAENELLAPAQIGSGATSNLATTGANTANSISSLMTGIGNAQASGTVGSANALTSGLTGATNSLTQQALLAKLLQSQSPSPSVINPGMAGIPPANDPYGGYP